MIQMKSSYQLESRRIMNQCIICGNQEFIPIYSNTLKKCTRCGFTTANMKINHEALEETYSINYFFGEEYLDYLQDKEILQLNFKKRIHYIKKIIANKLPVTNCLEIGCAYGFFGEMLKKHWNTVYTGIDVVPEVIHYGKDYLKLDLMTGDYLELPAPEKLYSDVFMWDVIEHLQFPDKFLQKLYQELAPEGRIYITTGDFSAFLPRIQGKKWRMIHPPSHIHYFTKENLYRLLEAYGFSIVRSKYLPVYRSIRQMFYSLFLLNKKGSFMENLLNRIPARWNLALNTYDIVFIIAEKR
jgi:2-polyprenyl-3-methyl-5-hydroxy-6-metoxy-1,4-benzoquinol methylase